MSTQTDTQEQEKKHNLSFPEAMTFVLNGEQVVRDEWKKQPVEMFVQTLFTFEDTEPRIVMGLQNDRCDIGYMPNWSASQQDMFARDWRIRRYEAPGEESAGPATEDESKSSNDSLFVFGKPPGLPAVPVLSKRSEDYFVDINKVAPFTVEVGGVEIITAPLKFNKKFDLLGLSTSHALLDTYLQDTTDCLDPAICLGNIYVEVDDVVVKVPVNTLPYSAMVQSVTGGYQELELSFTGRLDAGDVQVDVLITGKAHLQFGSVELYSKVVGFKTLLSNKPKVDLLGYDLQAYRVNMNRRPR